ncbi:hypothetical protein KGQ20_23850 [Catenulispora sp. NF23]|uniref:SAF domain-containing protein n=1 Tax=Catenulispora pinistramenti TaxID=2705254 RepID=A0ABS5L1R1_9ACTN|nr:hypothetical protein [Catenulispora pinistramenti]MBS2535801.1 hypothetical protein [Catenulispora pinistramenti]MBS2552262.1 hypothetical protein [Catenulispora pinistramenti]
MSKDRTTPGAPAAGAAFGGRGVAATRLPTAPRERKPALAALAVLLILAGALGTMLLVTQSGHRVDVVRVGNTTIAAGSKLDAGDFVETSVAQDNDIHYFKWSQLSALQGQTTYNTLVKGSLLTSDMLTDQSSVPAGATPGNTLMGVQVKQGHYPTGQMYPGDQFTLYTETVTPGPNGQSGTPTWTQLCTVTLVNRDNADTMTATIAVPTDKVTAVANASDLMLTKTFG